MVTSPHALASEAGLEVLRAGGNAIEAAIAIGATLSVTYPHFTGLGGDAFWIIADAGGKVRTLSGIGQAAAAPPTYGNGIPARGPAAALTTAATVDTWDRAYQVSRDTWGGTTSWDALFHRAIEYADAGFPVTPSQHFWQGFRAGQWRDWPGFSRVFLPERRIPEPGERFRQPELAGSLRRIAAHGAREFYEGELAERIARGLREAGSPLTAADLAATHAREESPLRVRYRDGELLSLRPPTQGVTTLQIMGILDRFDVAAVTAWKRGQPSVITGGVEESPLAASWRLTYPYNLTGMPAVSVPCGFDSRGLPAGLQIAGKMFDEATILRVAHAYEGVHRWHEGVPGVAA